MKDKLKLFFNKGKGIKDKKSKKQLMTNIIIYLENIKQTISIPKEILGKYSIYQIISKYLNYHINTFYLIRKDNGKIIPINNQLETDTQKQIIILDINFRQKGGFFLDLISSFFEIILYPIVYPFRGILNAFLLMIKAVVYIVALAMYAIKVIIWFFVDFIPSIPGDMVAFIQFFTTALFDFLFGTITHYIRMGGNKLGQMTIRGTMGWDNVPNENTENDGESDYFNNECADKKCYKTPDGTVPFSVVIATILCPPVGVFMEYGLLGWFNVFVCAILTLMFYFPGLIYALIILYC